MIHATGVGALLGSALVMAASDAGTQVPQPLGGPTVPADRASAPSTANDRTFELSGQVVDIAGRPVADVGVFATESGTTQVRAWARSDQTGVFRMNLGSLPHDFAVKSPIWIATRIRLVDARKIVIVVTRTFGEAGLQPGMSRLEKWVTVRVASQAQAPPLAGSTTQISGPAEAGAIVRKAKSGTWLGILSGQIFDETGSPLPGVVVLAAEKGTSAAIASARSDKNGRFALAMAGGVYLISAQAPGLRLGRAKKRPSGQVDLVMSVDARAETVEISGRPVLRFKITDSIWPEYVPPPAVQSELRFTYGIDVDTFCPGDLLTGDPCGKGRLIKVPCQGPAATCSTSMWQRQCKVPKFWWLRLLRATPPSPARLPAGCRYWGEMMAELQAAEEREEQAIGKGP